MISPNLMILKGRNRGLTFAQLTPLYAEWLRTSTGDNNTSAKLLDITIQGRPVSSYARPELLELAKDDSLTVWELDAILSHLDKPIRQRQTDKPGLPTCELLD